jgi:hypothetical protein
MNAKGGIILPKVAKTAASANVGVSWEWYDQANGLVKWTFVNNSQQQQTVILLRNGYYFGGAFWPVYVNNSQFGINWATALTPLADNGFENNAPVLGLTQFSSGQIIENFLFTLGAGQTWSMLEGGFSTLSPPSGAQLFEVSLNSAGEFCVGYDPQQVIDWDTQSNTNYQGYSPNPNTITTVLVNASADAPYVQLFPNDSATAGACGATTPTPTPTPQPNPQPSPQPIIGCAKEIVQGVKDIIEGNTTTGIDEVEGGIFCLTQNLGISLVELELKRAAQTVKKDIEAHI